MKRGTGLSAGNGKPLRARLGVAVAAGGSVPAFEPTTLVRFGTDGVARGEQRCRPSSAIPSAYIRMPRRRSAFVITDTDDKLIAAAAMTGLSNRPNSGYRRPAATGMPSTL